MRYNATRRDLVPKEAPPMTNCNTHPAHWLLFYHFARHWKTRGIELPTRKEAVLQKILQIFGKIQFMMSAAWIPKSLYCLVAPTSNTESVQVEKMKFKILRLWLVTTAECSALSIEEIRPGAVHVDQCQCSNTELCAISTRVNGIVEPGRSKSANTRVDTTLDAGRSPSPLLQELKHCKANSLVNVNRSLKQT